jgi:hypothetical protein
MYKKYILSETQSPFSPLRGPGPVHVRFSEARGVALNRRLSISRMDV